MRTGKKILIGVVAVLAFLILCAGLVFNHYIGMIQHQDLDNIISPEDETFEVNGEGGLDPSEVDLDKVDPLMDDDLLNILLVGQDRRPGQGRQRSDSMILCSVNLKTNEVSMISFMRDLYVSIPGKYSDNRLNAPYVFGGFPLLKATLKQNFGVTIDGCFEVDFEGFEQVINTVGGVDIELTQAEASVVGGGAHAGVNHLNGKQALAYSRIRKLDSDFGRTERQRNVLTAVLNGVRGSSLTELNSIANDILPCMATDMSKPQIMGLLVKSAGVIGNAKVSTYNVPETGEYRSEMIRGMAVLVPNLTTIRNRLETCLPLD